MMKSSPPRHCRSLQILATKTACAGALAARTQAKTGAAIESRLAIVFIGVLLVCADTSTRGDGDHAPAATSRQILLRRRSPVNEGWRCVAATRGRTVEREQLAPGALGVRRAVDRRAAFAWHVRNAPAVQRRIDLDVGRQLRRREGFAEFLLRVRLALVVDAAAPTRSGTAAAVRKVSAPPMQ